jgi:hypothetical protein
MKATFGDPSERLKGLNGGLSFPGRIASDSFAT